MGSLVSTGLPQHSNGVGAHVQTTGTAE